MNTPALQPLNVMIVEDVVPDAELVLQKLRREGFSPLWMRVETQADFLLGLRMPPDIILCDYSMPKFSGLQALELLRESGRDIPLIMISGTMGEDLAVEAMRLGAVDYVLKDRIARLGSAVRRALKEWQLREAHRQAEARYRTMVKNFPNGGVVLFDRKLRFLLADGAGMAEAGLVKEKVEGKTPRELFPPETCAIIEPNYQAAIAGESRVFELSFAGYIYESHSLPVRDAQGEIVGGMAMTLNITERKKAEEKIQNQLLELQRWRDVTLGREERVATLKKEVNELLAQTGQPPRYGQPEWAGKKNPL